MGERTFLVDDCERLGSRRGLCQPHYRRARVYGDPLGEPSPVLYERVCACGVEFTARRSSAAWCSESCRVKHARGQLCSVGPCANFAIRRGWCQMHYARWYRNGDPLVASSKPALPAECAVDGCAGERYAKGWCAVHYGRWFNHGSTDERVEWFGCIDCATLFLRTRQGGALRCDQCRSIADAESARRAMRKKAPTLRAERASARAGRTRPCSVCASIIVPSEGYGPVPRTCSDECRDVYRKLTNATWRATNADKVRDYQHNRRAAKRQAPSERIDQAVVARRDGGLCGLCGELVDETLRWPDPMSPSLDHVIPLSRGGSHTYGNVQLAHYSCNLRKGARLL